MAQNTTAFEQAVQAREEFALSKHIESFFKDYAPHDRGEAAQFHSDLHMLVRHIYADAQKPILAQWTAMMGALPPVIFTTEKPKS
jgi:hypothetical protein